MASLARASKLSPTEDDRRIGARIRVAREIRGRTQNEVARYLDISYQQFQKYEIGANRVPLVRLIKTAEFLDLDLLELMGQRGGMVSAETVEILGIPGATSLLRDYARITDPGHRQALLVTAQSLAMSAARKQ